MLRREAGKDNQQEQKVFSIVAELCSTEGQSRGLLGAGFRFIRRSRSVKRVSTEITAHSAASFLMKKMVKVSCVQTFSTEGNPASRPNRSISSMVNG